MTPNSSMSSVGVMISLFACSEADPKALSCAVAPSRVPSLVSRRAFEYRTASSFLIQTSENALSGRRDCCHKKECYFGS